MPSNQHNALAVSSRLARLEPGMYIFRFASQLAESTKACIGLQQAPLGSGSIDFFPGEGVSKNTLSKLGDCVIGRVKGGPTAVLMTEYRLKGDSAEPIDLRIDRIDTSAAIIRKPDTELNSEPEAAQLSLLGHIERRGDVTVRDHWLGDAGSRNRLEGFAVSWPNKPDGVDLVYTCSVAGVAPIAPVASGNYVGSRGQAAPITAVAFDLVGPNSARYRLSGEAAFAASGPQPVKRGTRLAGRASGDHLVAIKLSIVPDPEINAARYQSPWEDPAVTQIYVADGTKGVTA